MYPLRRSNTYGSYKRCGAFVCSRHCIAHDMMAQVAPDDLRQLIATVTAAWDIRVCEGSRIEIDYLLPPPCPCHRRTAAAAPVLSSDRRRYIMLPAAVHRRSQALPRERTP